MCFCWLWPSNVDVYCTLVAHFQLLQRECVLTQHPASVDEPYGTILGDLRLKVGAGDERNRIKQNT